MALGALETEADLRVWIQTELERGAVLSKHVRNLPPIYAGTGSPEAVVAAPRGALWLRQDGGAGTTLYVKEDGPVTKPFTDTGWVGK